MNTRIKFISLIFVFFTGVALWILSPIMIRVPSPHEILVAYPRSNALKTNGFQTTYDEIVPSQLEPERKSLLKGEPICKIHQEKLKTDIVKIKYGLAIQRPEREEAEATLFPNSNRIVHGGCIPGSRIFQCVLYCGHCRRAEMQWDVQPHPSISVGENAINEAEFHQVTATKANLNLVKRVEPYYPVLAEKSGISGVVTLIIYIDKKGEVVHAKVQSGHPLLYTAAYLTVKKWKYKPFLKNQKSVNVATNVTVVFLLGRDKRLNSSK